MKLQLENKGNVIGPWANLRLVDKRSKELVELLATSVS